MNAQAFKDAYGASRNGTDSFTRHGLVRNFAYSFGVGECADAGCRWLLDIIATEVAPLLPKFKETLGTVTVLVAKRAAKISLSGGGDVFLWSRRIDYTDMPEGEWVFFVAHEEGGFRMILVSEY